MKNLIKKILCLLPDYIYIQLQYFHHFHRFANLKNPQTFNEKLQWLKLHDRKPLYTTLVDKYAVKKWVADKIGAEYIIPTLGVWEKAEDIDFDKLPSQFVLKVNHDSGSLVICKDKSKLDKKAAIAKLSKALKNNGYWYGREWPYKNVKPCIIAEKYMEDNLHSVQQKPVLTDYKFFCFNGTPKIMYVSKDKAEDPRTDFFDMDGKHLPLHMKDPNADDIPPLPLQFKQMQKISQLLSVNFPFVRIDFYDINNQIYFGEFTFYHASGFAPVNPKGWDKKIGDWLKLPLK